MHFTFLFFSQSLSLVYKLSQCPMTSSNSSVLPFSPKSHIICNIYSILLTSPGYIHLYCTNWLRQIEIRQTFIFQSPNSLHVICSSIKRHTFNTVLALLVSYPALLNNQAQSHKWALEGLSLLLWQNTECQSILVEPEGNKVPES